MKIDSSIATVWKAFTMLLGIIVLLVNSNNLISATENPQVQENTPKASFPLEEGEILIQSVYKKSPIQKVELVKIKEYDQYDTGKFIEQEFAKDARRLHINIPQTPFWLWIVDGQVTSFFYSVETGELWKLRGMEEYFQYMTSIFVESPGKIHLYGGKDPGPIQRWTLDFSDPQKGLIIEYLVSVF